jgi:hypothetical protein
MAVCWTCSSIDQAMEMPLIRLRRCAMKPILLVVRLMWWVHGLDEINGTVRPNKTRLDRLAVVPWWCLR